MIREPFTKKYANIATRWNIDSGIVLSILERYESLLAIELEKLKTEKMTLKDFFKDTRTVEEYIYDLIDGWVMEDIICEAWLKPRLMKVNPSIVVQSTGTDSDRIIQKSNSQKITTLPDITFQLDDRDVNIELQMARKAIPKGYDMKETKVKRAIKNGNFFLWIIIPEDTYFIIDTQSEIGDIIPQVNFLWGGKMVYHIDSDFIEKIGGYAQMRDELSPTNRAKLGLGRKK